MRQNQKKKILLIGGGLYGCLLAYQLSKKSNKIILVEKSDKLLNSLNSVSIKNFRINNGFHGIEIPRCNEFIHFLKNKLNLKLIVKDKIHKLLIFRSIIDFKDGISKWPKSITKNLKKNYIIKKNYNLKDFYKNKLYDLIKTCSKRFNKNFKDCNYYFIPWFLPKDYKMHNIKDEGDIFREKVRNKKVNFQYAVPREKIFQIFQTKFYNILKKRNVSIYLNTRVKLEKNFLEISKKQISKSYKYDKFDKIFYCTHSPFLLEYANIKHLKKLYLYKKYMINLIIEVKTKINLTEMICVNKTIPNLNRISVISSNKKKSFLQLEILQEKTKLSKKFIKKINNELKIVFNLKNNPKYYGHKISRTVFFPSTKWKSNAKKFIKKWQKNNKFKLNVRHDLFGAINMAKSWNYAKTDAGLKRL